METKDLSPTEFGDIFGPSVQKNVSTPAFGGGIDDSVDLFNPIKQVDNPDIPIPIDDKDKEKDKVVEEIREDADLFDETPKPSTEGDDNKVEIKGLSEYYEDRLKSGLFVEINEEDDKGNKKSFIPKTPEEFDEVIELQVNFKLDQAKKELENKWYESKSPAWKAVSQYAEMIDDPSQLIPFLQGVKTISTVSQLNEEDNEQAEQIVRARLEQRGDPEQIIKTQIESLKASDALISTAKQIKPLMVREEQMALSKQVEEARVREQQYLQVVNDIRDKAHKAIEQPLFGKQKLKQEEKALIYDMIAYPSEETQGYGIYSAIDKLFDNKDFETLKQVALLVGKKDAFFQYLGTDVANKTATSLQKKLTVAADGRSSSSNNIDIDDKPIISRNSFSKTPRFGK